MPAFEPSTWAEVSEAAVSRKDVSLNSDIFVTHVRAFTDAPERFLVSAPSVPPSAPPPVRRLSLNAETTLDDDVVFDKPDHPLRLPRAPLAAVKRHDGLFDDVLGLGRVDAESESLIKRRGGIKSADELCLTLSSGNESRFVDSGINPSGPHFDPLIYLSQVHSCTSLEELRTGKEVLEKVRASLNDDAETFRGEKYASATLVEAALEKTKKRYEPLSPFVKGKGGIETEKLFDNAETMLGSRYESVLSRETKLSSLRRALGVYTRYHWVFSLGAKLRSCAGEGVAAVEHTVKEFIRAQKWVEAQDGADLSMIESDISNGFNVLGDALLTRLSTGQLSRQDSARLVAVLTSVKREDLLTNALSRRVNFAAEGLRKACEPMVLAPIPEVKGIGSREKDTTELISRSNIAFYDGMTHIWKLGRVLYVPDRWMKTVHNHLFNLCQSYVNVLREHLLEDVTLISRDAVKGIVNARRKAVMEIQVPETCLMPLVEVSKQISDSYVDSVSRAVTESVERIAIQAVQSNSVGSNTAILFRSTVVEALEQVDFSLVDKAAGRTNDNIDPDLATSEVLGEIEQFESIHPRDDNVTMVTVLGNTCAELPVKFAQNVRTRLWQTRITPETCTLKLAVLFAELLGGVVTAIAVKMGAGSVFERRGCRQRLQESEKGLREMLAAATGTYVRLVAKPLKTLAAGLVSFPEEELEDSMNRSVQIKIEGISKSANEVTLQLALITIATRNASRNAELVRRILLALIQATGDTLVEVLSTDKLIYHRAAQLWVDVTYMQDMITRGADSDTKGLQEALDGYSRVKERSVQAVLADGYSFSIADMEVLRESVVAGGMALADMVQECFRETWGMVGRSETDED